VVRSTERVPVPSRLRPALGGESFDGLELLVDFLFGRAVVV
jgi:hypothetical protein